MSLWNDIWRKGQYVGFDEHRNQTLGFKDGGEFLDQLRDCQILNKDLVKAVC